MGDLDFTYSRKKLLSAGAGVRIIGLGIACVLIRLYSKMLISFENYVSRYKEREWGRGNLIIDNSFIGAISLRKRQ
jgi:hypothetical protein